MKKLFSSKFDSSLQGKEFVINNRKVVVENVIAEGGHSVVFLVFCEAEIMKYALKRMFVNNRSSLDLCLQEISISMKLSGHKNVVKLVDTMVSHASNGVKEVLILMQFYPGNILKEMNQKVDSGFSEEEVLKIMRDVCEAVALMHSCNPPIIHRDLKAENLLRDTSGNYILCDFGSATTLVLDPQVHGVNIINEEIQKHTTPAYRSPEMIDPYSNRPITTKSDIWALGCLLYKLCFFVNCFGDSALAISSGNLTIPDQHHYSVDLVRLIKYMLEVDMELRPDIFQVCSIVYKLSGLPCHILNRSVIKANMVNISSLPLLTNESKTKPNKQVTISQMPDQLDQVPGTSINPRERPRGQLTLCPQAFNLTPPAHALTVHSDSSSSSHISNKVGATQQLDHLSKLVVTTSNSLVYHDFQDILSNQPRSMNKHSPDDDKPLIDFCTTQFQNVFSPNVSMNTLAQSYQLPLTQEKPRYFSQPQSFNHSRTFSNCQSSFSIALPSVNQQSVPLQNARQNWNPFQPQVSRLNQASTISPNGNSNDLTTSWQLQNLLSRHRRNMSDTSALFNAIQTKSQALQLSSQTAENLNSNASIQQATWQNKFHQPQELQPHHVHYKKQTSTKDGSLVQQFDDLTLRCVNSTASLNTLNHSATSSFPKQSSISQNHSALSVVTDQQVDAFGAVPFQRMVSEIRSKHPQMGHKRSISDL